MQQPSVIFVYTEHLCSVELVDLYSRGAQFDTRPLYWSLVCFLSFYERPSAFQILTYSAFIVTLPSPAVLFNLQLKLHHLITQESSSGLYPLMLGDTIISAPVSCKSSSCVGLNRRSLFRGRHPAQSI
jgi:hypothetical protein